MTLRTLSLRSLRFHWRAHLGVLLGASVGSAALIGALVVGDSVRGSLRERALQRLGPITAALNAGDRLVTADLAQRLVRWGGLMQKAAHATNREYAGFVVPVLHLNAVLSKPDGTARANDVNLYAGLDGFVVPSSDSDGESLRGLFDSGLKDGAYLNGALARQLRVGTGDEVLLRVRKPRSLSADAVLSPHNNASATAPLHFRGVIRDADLGNFSLRGGTSLPLNGFVDAQTLADRMHIPLRANLLTACWVWSDRPSSVRTHLDALLARTGILPGFYGVKWHDVPVALLNRGLREVWRLDDAQAQLRPVGAGNYIELSSSRVFLDPPIVTASTSAGANALPLLTYLANLFRAGTNATPYSMVTAAGPPWTPADLRDDEILVSQWLADNLRVQPGDTIVMTYFLPESGARLTEATNRFRVRAIVPMEMPWADRTLMPEFPGIEKAESTADWDTAFPLVHKIRPQDERYWKQYRGTPKAFVTLAAGQKMWGNRFGDLTAIRFPVPTNAAPLLTADEYRAAIEKKILATLKPEEVGLRFEPVREQALQAAEQSQDFGGLFLGFSFFLIAAALLLMALLFQFGVEQRVTEVGTLLALGFRPRQVRRLLLGEGVALAALGAVLGALGGVGYAQAMLLGLATLWRDAVGASALQFHATAGSVATGIVASVAAAAVAIGLTLRGLAKRPARELLAGETRREVRNPKSEIRRNFWSAGRRWVPPFRWLALAGALALVGWAVGRGDTADAETFFSAGALLLLAGLGFAAAGLARLAGTRPGSSAALADRRGGAPTLGSLALGGATRRRSRSLATAALLACGTFLIVSIGVFRLDANRDAPQRTAGTGGFALIGESTLPVVPDLNTPRGRDAFALRERDLAGVSVVPFRVHAGDEASCLNLNRAQRPRLLGVKPELLAGRFTFAQAAQGLELRRGWELLKDGDRGPRNSTDAATPARPGTQPPAPDGREDVVPAIGDLNAILWAMGKKVGDTIDFTDEHGRAFKVRIVGAVANSILQGSLIIDEAEFVKRFPSESGCRFFLMDAPTNAAATVSAALSRALEDYGLEVTPAARRLAQFNAVQNTYLDTFQVLGGLGLLLGSAGLGVVVLRNVLERRGELAVLLALGFRRRTLQRLVLSEHAALLALGLAIGGVAAAVAVLPGLLSSTAPLPWPSLALTLIGVLANGAAWTWLATHYALRGNLLDALRNE